MNRRNKLKGIGLIEWFDCLATTCDLKTHYCHLTLTYNPTLIGQGRLTYMSNMKVVGLTVQPDGRAYDQNIES